MEHTGEADQTERQSRTVLFADVCDSSRLFQRLGDERARRVVVEALQVVRKVVEGESGTVVDSIGDELFCAFQRADSAVRAGVRIHEEMLDASFSEAGKIQFRVGLHHGPVGIDGSSVYGDTVHLAQRLVALAKPEQVLTTSETLKQLEAPPACRLFDRTHVKGRETPVEIIEIEWSSSATIDIGRGMRKQDHKEELVLALPDGKEVVISATHPSVTLGRGEMSGLRIDEDSVSRLHARIEMRGSDFKFVDLSRNGSTVWSDEGPPQAVLRDQIVLGREGKLRLGQEEGSMISFRRRPGSSSPHS